MAQGYVSALVNSVLKNVIAAIDSSGGVAAGSLEVDVNGAALGTAANPKIVGIATWGSSVATGQVSVDTTTGGKLIVAARSGRRSVTIIQEGTTLIRLGPSGVTMSSGVPLPGTPYATFTFEGGAAIYGTLATGSQTVSFAEAF